MSKVIIASDGKDLVTQDKLKIIRGFEYLKRRRKN